MLEGRVFALRRWSPDGEEEVLCIHNVSGAPVSVRLPRTEASDANNWEGLVGPLMEPGRAGLQLGPYQTAWIAGPTE